MTAKATCNGNITATGGENCTSRGFEWGLVLGGPYPNSWTENGTFGTGAFSHEFTGLDENTLIYYRAKAYNSAGWGYGGEESFTTWKAVSVSETGAGTDTVTVADVLIEAADAGIGTEAAPTVEATIGLTDSGLGTEALDIAAAVPVSETGVGAETIGMDATHTLTDAGVGAEADPQVTASIPISDAGSGVEVAAMTASLTVTETSVGVDLLSIAYDLGIITDSGLGTENVSTPGTLTITEEGKGAEFAWRIKPSNPMIDALALPHVLSIIIPDVASMSDKKVQGGSLPRRKMVGKQGRTVTIEGWTDEQSDIDALEALLDGITRTFYHPSGDSFAVLVTAFNPDRRADKRDRRDYYLTLMET